MVESTSKPTIGVLIASAFAGKQAPNSMASEVLTAELHRRGFKVMALRIGDSAKFARATRGDVEAASLLALELDAEIVVVGTCTTDDHDVSGHPMFQNTNMRKSGADLVLHAIDASTRTILASQEASAVDIHLNSGTARDLATRKAVHKMTLQNGLLDRMLNAWSNKPHGLTVINVKIRGIPNYKASVAATAEIQAKAQKISGRKLENGVLTLDATWQGTVDDFCNYLDSRMFNEDQNTLSVVSAQKNSVLLEVK